MKIHHYFSESIHLETIRWILKMRIIRFSGYYFCAAAIATKLLLFLFKLFISQIDYAKNVYFFPSKKCFFFIFIFLLLWWMVTLLTIVYRLLWKRYTQYYKNQKKYIWKYFIGWIDKTKQCFKMKKKYNAIVKLLILYIVIMIKSI